MAPHWTAQELDKMRGWRELTPQEVHQRLKRGRDQRNLATPNIKQVRKAMAGKTFKLGVAETRGAKRKLSKRNVRRLNTVRKDLIKKAKGEREVHWQDIIKAARVPQVSPKTARENLKAAGYDITRRAPRLKPLRTEAHEQARVVTCGKWSRWPATYWTDSVDMIIDNKKWDLPLSKSGKTFCERAASPVSSAEPLRRP